jgi:hypothetical protein
MKSFMEKEKPHRSSLLVVTVKDQTSFGKYICHIRDRFKSTTHTISIQKDTGNTAFDLFIIHTFYKTKPNQNTIRFCFKLVILNDCAFQRCAFLDIQSKRVV